MEYFTSKHHFNLDSVGAQELNNFLNFSSTCWKKKNQLEFNFNKLIEVELVVKLAVINNQIKI